jgi:hypothetical protein
MRIECVQLLCKIKIGIKVHRDGRLVATLLTKDGDHY